MHSSSNLGSSFQAARPHAAAAAAVELDQRANFRTTAWSKRLRNASNLRVRDKLASCNSPKIQEASLGTVF